MAKEEEGKYSGEDFTFIAPELQFEDEQEVIKEEITKNDEKEDDSTSEEVQGKGEEVTKITEEKKEKSEDSPPSRDKSVKSDKDNSSSRMSVSQALAKALHEGGYISEYKDEDIKDGGVESVFGLLDQEMNRRVDDYIQGLDDDLKDIVEAREAGVNIDSYKSLKSKIIELKSIDDTKLEADEELRKSLLKRYYKETTKLSDDKIDKMIKRTIDLDEDVDEAKTALSELIKIDNEKASAEKTVAQNLVATRAKQAKEKLSEIKTTIEGFDEVVPGLKLTTKEKTNLFKTLTDVVLTVKDQRGNDIPLNAVMANRAKNPTKWDGIVAYFHQIGLLNFTDKGDWKPDFTKIVKGSKSSAVKDLEEVLKSEETSIKDSQGTSGKGSFGDIESDLGDVDFTPLFRNK